MLEDFVKYGRYYDLYQGLLTNKEQVYFQEYYFDNLSFSEIAENHQISRSAVHKTLKNVLKKLELYEEALHLLDKDELLVNLINDLDELSSEKIREKLNEIR